MFLYAYEFENKFELEALVLYFLWHFRSRCSSRLHNISLFNNRYTPTISGRYHQHQRSILVWPFSTTSWGTKIASKCFHSRRTLRRGTV